MDYAIARRLMVDRQIMARGIKDPLVIEAMKRVPRHRFVEEAAGREPGGCRDPGQERSEGEEQTPGRAQSAQVS